jgi:cytochrome c oxidase assembly protein subunit 15
MGCGDHWPKCLGAWFPPLDRIDLIIEISHRYLALALSLVILALVISAWRSRTQAGVAGPGGVLRPVIVAGVLVVVAALLGAVTVKLLLNPFVIAAHLTIAMSLLATLALAYFRTGGLGAGMSLLGGSPRASRSARIAVVMAILTLVLGALTANLPNAASSCTGFPICRTITAEGTALVVHIIHRVLAFLLFGHLLGIAIATGKRKEPKPVRTAARFAFGAAFVQVLIAAAMIETGFPAFLRSLHQAVGTLVWLAIVTLAILATAASRAEEQPVAARAAA